MYPLMAQKANDRVRLYIDTNGASQVVLLRLHKVGVKVLDMYAFLTMERHVFFKVFWFGLEVGMEVMDIHACQKPGCVLSTTVPCFEHA